jgi:hypothetical protein
MRWCHCPVVWTSGVHSSEPLRLNRAIRLGRKMDPPRLVLEPFTSSEPVRATCHQGPKSSLGGKLARRRVGSVAGLVGRRSVRGPPAAYPELRKRDQSVRESQRVVAPIGASSLRVSSDTHAAPACSAEGNVSRDPVHDSVRKQSIR